MDYMISDRIAELERTLGFPIDRRPIPYGLGEPHDEIFSYNLCLRFQKNDELEKAIGEAREILRMLLTERKRTGDSGLDRTIGLFYSLIGNMYYIFDDFILSAGFFVESLSYEKDDITPWVELLFSLRAVGEFELFEKGIFNLEKLVTGWRDSREKRFSQDKFLELIKVIK